MAEPTKNCLKCEHHRVVETGRIVAVVCSRRSFTVLQTFPRKTRLDWQTVPPPEDCPLRAGGE